MASISLYIGIISLIAGVFLLISPSMLKRANEFSARIVTKFDSLTFSYRIGFGVSLLIASVFMFFMAYYFARKH
jgi:uncharacterized BrkB/YihY/UPF0761 family membrane protein